MKKFTKYIFLVLFIPSFLYSQKEYNEWVLGYNIDLTFNTSNLEPEEIGKYSIIGDLGFKYSVICDTNGILKFYSSPAGLFDNDMNPVNNSDNMECGNYKRNWGSDANPNVEDIFGWTGARQSTLLLKVKDTYLRVANHQPEGKLTYSLFNDNGVYSKNNLIIRGYQSNSLYAIKNFKNNNYWLIAYNEQKGEYLSFRVDENGIETEPEHNYKSITYDSCKFKYILSGNQFVPRSELKASPNGQYIVRVSSCFNSYNYNKSFFEIINFNPLTGKFEGIYDRLNLGRSISAEFSLNSRYLYLSSTYNIENAHESNIYQVDLFSDNIYSFEDDNLLWIVDDDDIRLRYMAATLQLSPNGKIYWEDGTDHDYQHYRQNRYRLFEISNPNENGNTLKTKFTMDEDEQESFIVEFPNIPTSVFQRVYTESVNEICEEEDIRLKSFVIYPQEDTLYNWSGPNGFSSNEQNPLLENLKPEDEGIYTVTVSGGDEDYTAQTYIKVNPKPQVKITAEPDTFSCPGDSIVLTANPEYETYQWNTGDTTRSTTVYESGKYFVSVVDSNGCEGIAEIEVTFADDITVNIQGPDSICYGEEAELICEEEFASYEWSTGDTTRSIIVSEAGKYTLTVTTEDGCEASETFEVNYHPIVRAELKTAPTSICIGDTVTLESKYQSPDYEYLWNTQATTKSIEVTESGTYELVITDTKTGCQNSTEITINVEEELNVEIIGNEGFCEGESAILKVVTTNDNYSYKWSTGETKPQIEVSESGTYTVEVSTERCSGEAEFKVTEHPLPEFTIEGDRIICEGETTTLTSSKEFKQYEWSNGETTRSITVGEGDYTLTVTDKNGCTSSEPVTVEEKNVELAFESMKYDFGKVYISESRDTTIEITNNSGEEATAIINGDQVNISEDGYTYQYNLDNSSTGEKQDFITIEVTEPCEAEYQIEITAEVYARVTLSTINIHTEIGATETVPYYLEAEADLGEQEFNITTDIERDLFFTNDSYQIPSPQVINQQRSKIHEQTGMILLTEFSNYPITFSQVQFDDPYIEKDTSSGKITFDSVCIHDLRVVEIHEPSEISVAPNPVHDIINIDISTGEEGNFTIELISTDGRTTYTDSWNQSSSSKNIQIDTRDISTGVYQIRLTTEGHVYRKEVVVME